MFIPEREDFDQFSKATGPSKLFPQLIIAYKVKSLWWVKETRIQEFSYSQIRTQPASMQR